VLERARREYRIAMAILDDNREDADAIRGTQEARASLRRCQDALDAQRGYARAPGANRHAF